MSGFSSFVNFPVFFHFFHPVISLLFPAYFLRPVSCSFSHSAGKLRSIVLLVGVVSHGVGWGYYFQLGGGGGNKKLAIDE